MDLGRHSGVAESSEVAAIREQLETKEELIQLKDARIFELVGIIERKDKEIQSKDEEIKALNEKLRGALQNNPLDKEVTKRTRHAVATGTAQTHAANDKDESATDPPDKPSTATPIIEKSLKKRANVTEFETTNAHSQAGDDLDDLPRPSIMDKNADDDNNDVNVSAENTSPASEKLDSQSTAEEAKESMQTKAPNKKASPPKKRDHVHNANGSSSNDTTTAEKPPRKRNKPSQSNETKASTLKPKRPWEELYQELIEFKQKTGLTKAPNKEGGLELWRFYQYQRQKYNLHKQGKTPEDLTPERIQKLEAIGFAETCRTPGEYGWETRFQELKAFKERHGHFRVSRHENYQLWGWIKTQRAGYRNLTDALTKGSAEEKKAGVARLSPEQMARLQSIGFEWEIQNAGYETSWERRFTELLKYKSEHGTTHVPRNYAANYQLAMWVKHQRKKYAEIQKGKPRRGLLTDDRIRRLDEIGFEWRVRP